MFNDAFDFDGLLFWFCYVYFFYWAYAHASHTLKSKTDTFANLKTLATDESHANEV